MDQEGPQTCPALVTSSEIQDHNFNVLAEIESIMLNFLLNHVFRILVRITGTTDTIFNEG